MDGFKLIFSSPEGEYNLLVYLEQTMYDIFMELPDGNEGMMRFFPALAMQADSLYRKNVEPNSDYAQCGISEDRRRDFEVYFWYEVFTRDKIIRVVFGSEEYEYEPEIMSERKANPLILN